MPMLAGAAQNAVHTAHNILTYDNACAVLHHRFGVTEEECLTKLMKLRQADMTLEKYLDRVDTYARIGKVDEKVVITALKEGL